MEKLTEHFGVKVGATTAERVQAVADALKWSDSQVIREALTRSLPGLEREAEQVREVLGGAG